jgi:hypothetical protein
VRSSTFYDTEFHIGFTKQGKADLMVLLALAITTRAQPPSDGAAAGTRLRVSDG